MSKVADECKQSWDRFAVQFNCIVAGTLEANGIPMTIPSQSAGMRRREFLQYSTGALLLSVVASKTSWGARSEFFTLRRGRSKSWIGLVAAILSRPA